MTMGLSSLICKVEYEEVEEHYLELVMMMAYMDPCPVELAGDM